MKILAVNAARAIWLLPSILLNPSGRNLVQAAQEAAERYRFIKVPDRSSLVTQPLLLKYEGGSFVNKQGVPLWVNLSIHDDGLMAETRASTDESELFLGDLLSWLSEQYGLPRYQDLGMKRLYASELVVQLDKPLKVFNDKFSAFVQRLETGLSNNAGVPLLPVSLNFGPDPALTKSAVPFRFERLVNSDFRENRYYSYAPIRTSEHIELLEAFEAAAA